MLLLLLACAPSPPTVELHLTPPQVERAEALPLWELLAPPPLEGQDEEARARWCAALRGERLPPEGGEWLIVVLGAAPREREERQIWVLDEARDRRRELARSAGCGVEDPPTILIAADQAASWGRVGDVLNAVLSSGSRASLLVSAPRLDLEPQLRGAALQEGAPWLHLRRDSDGRLRAGVRALEILRAALKIETRPLLPLTTLDKAIAGLDREEPRPAGALLTSDRALPWATVAQDFAVLRARPGLEVVLAQSARGDDPPPAAPGSGSTNFRWGSPLPVLSYLSPSDAPRSPDG